MKSNNINNNLCILPSEVQNIYHITKVSYTLGMSIYKDYVVIISVDILNLPIRKKNIV